MKRQEIDFELMLPVDEQYHFETCGEMVSTAIEALVQHCHAASWNKGWWHDPISGENLLPSHVNGEANELREAYRPYVIATKIALIHSEASEALEAIRKDAMDDKLPEFKGITTELADVVIRVCDLIGMLSISSGNSQEYNLALAILRKLTFNKTRADHNVVMRRAAGGKAF